MLLAPPALPRRRARAPNALALNWVDRNVALSAEEAVDGMERMAGTLAHLGVAPGDRVLIFAHNGMDYLLAMLGTWRLGAISALVNVKYADDLAYYVDDHRPKSDHLYPRHGSDSEGRCRDGGLRLSSHLHGWPPGRSPRTAGTDGGQPCPSG